MKWKFVWLGSWVEYSFYGIVSVGFGKGEYFKFCFSMCMSAINLFSSQFTIIGLMLYVVCLISVDVDVE